MSTNERDRNEINSRAPKRTSKDRNERIKAAKRRKRRQRRRLGLLIATLIIAIIALGVVQLFSSFSKLKRTSIDDKNLEISDKFDKNSSNYSDIFKDIENIALFGVDQKVDNVQRSDAIMIGTLDKTHKKLKVTSLMRDTYVNIPEYGYDKLTHAYAYGGAQLSIATINKNFDLNITDYVAVDFSELQSIIDAIGGVDIELDDEDIESLNDYLSYVHEHDDEPYRQVERGSNGMVHLDGVEALGYSRNRSTPDGDFGRTERQRNLIDAMFQRISGMGVAKLASIMTKLLPYVETSLSNSEILTLGTEVLSMGSLSVEKERFPRADYSENAIINDVFYYTFDEDIARQEIYDYLFNDKKTW